MVLNRSLNRLPALLLLVAGAVSVGAWGSMPHEGFHPFALLTALLPLQLAAVFWCIQASSTAVARPPSGLRPPTSG